jgi:hypothetical protein
MRPLFTSAAEWETQAEVGEERYVDDAVGHTARAGALGLSIFLFTMPLAPWPRLLGSLLLMGLSYAGCLGLARLLFKREWRAAARTYGYGILETRGQSRPR